MAEARSPVYEIERRYLLDRMPALPADAEKVLIEQGYLEERPRDADGLSEGRLRRITRRDGSVEHRHTIKRGVGLVREERECTVPADTFDVHWPRTVGARIRKTRWIVPVGASEWVVDDFAGLDLVLAEVELPAASTPAVPPPWLAGRIVREVTDDVRYTNAMLARYGRP